MRIPPTFRCSSLFKDGFFGKSPCLFFVYLARGDMKGYICNIKWSRRIAICLCDSERQKSQATFGRTVPKRSM